MANGTLGHRFGMAPTNRQTSGPAFLAKRALNAAVARTGWLDEVRTANKPIEFTLDKDKTAQTAKGTPAE